MTTLEQMDGFLGELLNLDEGITELMDTLALLDGLWYHFLHPLRIACTLSPYEARHCGAPGGPTAPVGPRIFTLILDGS